MKPSPAFCIPGVQRLPRIKLGKKKKKKKGVWVFFNYSWMGCTELNGSPKEEATMKRVAFAIKEKQELITLIQ